MRETYPNGTHGWGRFCVVFLAVRCGNGQAFTCVQTTAVSQHGNSQASGPKPVPVVGDLDCAVGKLLNKRAAWQYRATCMILVW